MFKVPEEPGFAAMLIAEAARVPPSDTVRALLVFPFPTVSVPLLVQSEPAPVTSALLFMEEKPMSLEEAATVPPLEMTRLLPPLPPYPKKSVPLVFKREFAPVTSTLLFEEESNVPMKTALPIAVPPLLITKLLPLPDLPT
jgi:hypothetical protein